MIQDKFAVAAEEEDNIEMPPFKDEDELIGEDEEIE